MHWRVGPEFVTIFGRRFRATEIATYGMYQDKKNGKIIFAISDFNGREYTFGADNEEEVEQMKKYVDMLDNTN
ncbi:MAG: hypothetical protein IJT73_07645 [Selenomonadaceae bacterium]|nr:hypothetical protein [Selenomonadaceae bacterium]